MGSDRFVPPPRFIVMSIMYVRIKIKKLGKVYGRTMDKEEDEQSILFGTSSVHQRFSSEPRTHRRDSFLYMVLPQTLPSFSTSTMHSFMSYLHTYMSCRPSCTVDVLE